MNISSHDLDPVANISQEYIEHLKAAEQNASAERAIAQAELTAATSARDEVQTWELNIDGYWDRVKATEKMYHEIEDLINDFKNTACAVVQNTYCVAESAEILACMVRQMSAQTDALKQAMRTTLDRVASASQNNAFRPFMNEFLAAVDDAITANVEAIKKSLDVLKAAYLLHISIKGRRRLAENDVRFPLDAKYRKIMLGNQTIEILPYLDRDRGVESNLEHLLYIFTRGNAYPVGEDANALCPPPVAGDIPLRFPLHNDPNGYFHRTREQRDEARERLTTANWTVREKQGQFDRLNAKYASIQRSLAAALDAKSKTK